MSNGRFTYKGWICSLAFILVIIGGVGALVLSRTCGKSPFVVDMTDTVQSKVTATRDEDGRPVLSVAISAMISPATTRAFYQDFVTLLAAKIGRKAVFIIRTSWCLWTATSAP